MNCQTFLGFGLPTSFILKTLSLVVSLTLTLIILSPIKAGAVELRAGLEQNPPLSFINDQGEPAGLLVDILDQVAAQSGWQVTYVPDTFKNCLQKLSDHEIDLMVTIAYSKERAKRFDFNRINVVANWGVIYSSQKKEIQSYFDLVGANVAVMKNDTHHLAFRNLLENFDISVNYHEVDNFEEVFEALDSGQVDAGVVGRFFALGREETYAVKPTSLIFNPIEVRYATAKGLNNKFLQALDHNLERLKDDPTSIYYQSLDRWLGVPKGKNTPRWLWSALVILCTLLAFAATFMALLRWQVIVRTRKLHQETAKRTFAQRELEVAEQNYRNVVESANAIILRWDPQGVVTYINNFGEKLFGFADGELIGQNVVGTIVPEASLEGTDLVEMIHSIGEEPEEFRVNENENITKSGERVWISWRNQPVYDQFEVLIGILSVGLEITEKKEAEKARLQYDQAKDTFIATAAHELRTPLTGIIGFLELLTDSPGSQAFTAGQQKEFLETIKNSSFLLSRIVDDLLDVSLIQQGKPLTLMRQRYSLISLIKQLTKRYQTLYSEHSFQLQIHDDIGDEQLFDPERITQVLENLLSNAVKYSEDNSEVVIKLNSSEAWLKVTVSDQGVGMTTEQVAKVFDDFYRAGNSNTAVSGLGLGMGIVRQIVLEHGGDIWVESFPDVGTNVYFTLPVDYCNSKSMDAC
jgi:PAS domain S-box-containing protein